MRRIRIWTSLIAPLLFLSLNVLMAQGVAYKTAKTIDLSKELQTTSKWTLTIAESEDLENWLADLASGKVNDREEGTDRPLRYCFLKNPGSLSAITEWPIIQTQNPSVSYQELVSLQTLFTEDSNNSSHGIVLIAHNDGYRLGEAYKGLYSVSAWKYDKDKDQFESWFEPFSYSDQAEFRIMPKVGKRKRACLLLAEFIWGKREGRYQPHKFMIHIFIQSKAGRFTQISQYITSKKYPSFDDVDKIDVINHELTIISKCIPSN